MVEDYYGVQVEEIRVNFGGDKVCACMNFWLSLVEGWKKGRRGWDMN